MFLHKHTMAAVKPDDVESQSPEVPKSHHVATAVTASGNPLTNALGQPTETLKIAMIVIFYFVVSISLVFLNKYLMSGYHFPYPVFITWYQQLIAYLCIAVFTYLSTHGVPSLSFLPPMEADTNIMRQVLPLSLVFVGMLTFNNLCLQYVEVWFYQVARSLAILFSIGFTYFLLGEKTSKNAIGACAIVVLGFILGSIGNGSSSSTKGTTAAADVDPWAGFKRVAGIVFGLLSSVFVALYGIVMKRKMPVVNGNEWRLLNYNTLLSAILLVPVMFIAGEATVVYEELLLSPRFWMDMTITGLFGYLISLAIFMQVKATSPLTNNISGTAKACVQTILAILIWGSDVSFINAVGIFLVIGGSFCYSLVRYQEMLAKKAAAAASAALTATAMATASPSPK